MKRARTNNGKAKKRLTIFLLSFLAVCTIFVLMLGFHSVLFPMSGILDGDYVMPVDKATGKANALIVGVDADGLRTDTIIVASYDLDDNKIDMLSIPRDTRMYIGSSWQKINAAHSISKNGKRKGIFGTIEAVTRLTGIPINYYVEFSCDAFRKTIDALGGVEFDVPQRMYYNDPAQDLHINLQPGLQTLDGDKAEQLVRFRKYPGGDIDRVKMQQQFIKALAEQKLNLTLLTKVPDIYDALKDEVKTNLTLADVVKYLPNLKELSAENVVMHQVPGNFSGAEYSASYWLVNMDELKVLIETVFGYDTENIMTGVNGKTDPGGNKPKATASATPTPKKTPKPTSAPKADDDDEYVSVSDKTENDEKSERNENESGHTATPKPTSKPTPAPTAAPEVQDTDIIQLD